MDKDKPIPQAIQTPMGANFFKLNGSSFQSSTPGISTSQPKGQLVQFQQFQEPLNLNKKPYTDQHNQQKKQMKKTLFSNTVNPIKKPGLGMRNLTIKIDDNFASSQSDFINKGVIPHASHFNKPNLTLKIDEQSANISDTSSLSHSSNSNYNYNSNTSQLQNNQQLILDPLSNTHTVSQRVSNTSQRKFQTKQSQLIPQLSSHSNSKTQSQSQYLSKIQKLTSRVLIVQEKLFYYEDYNKKLLKENQQYKTIIQNHQKDLKKLSIILKKKDDDFDIQRKRSQALMKKLVQFQRQRDNIIQNQMRNSDAKNQKYDIKIKERDHQIKQLTKKNQKLQNINKILQKELRQSDKKIVDMQKQMHRNTCNNFLQNVNRLKQSSLKLKQTSISINKQNQNNNLNSHQSHNHSQTQARKSLQSKKSSHGINKTHRANSSNVNLLAKKLGQTHSHLK